MHVEIRYAKGRPYGRVVQGRREGNRVVQDHLGTLGPADQDRPREWAAVARRRLRALRTGGTLPTPQELRRDMATLWPAHLAHVHSRDGDLVWIYEGEGLRLLDVRGRHRGAEAVVLPLVLGPDRGTHLAEIRLEGGRGTQWHHTITSLDEAATIAGTAWVDMKAKGTLGDPRHVI